MKSFNLIRAGRCASVQPWHRLALVLLATAAVTTACSDVPTGEQGTEAEIGSSALASATAAHRRDVTQTYFFGASLTDAGNLAALGPFVPSPPYFQGRVSNGPVWAEYFADLLGTDATPSALGGSNYAVGGARASVVNFGFIPPITAQVADYLEDAGGVADPRALHVFVAPLNDVFAALTGPPEAAKQTVSAALDATKPLLTDLYNSGARGLSL